MAKMMQQAPAPRLIGQQMPKRLLAILVGLFLLQYVSWMTEEGSVWLPETVDLIKWAMLTTACAYFIPWVRGWLRIAIQLAAILIGNAIYLDYRFIPLAGWDWPQLSAFAAANAIQLMPYLAFTLGTWIVFELAMVLMSRQIWVYLILFSSIIAFCVRDSFSNLSLWEEVSTLLFIGVLLLVVSHMMRFQKTAPEAWTKLARKPYPILFPILALAIIFYGIVSYAPPVRPVLVDPYTAWMESQGQSVARFVDEDGVFSAFTSTANNESGYGRSDGKLGGAFQFNYNPVMTVESDMRTYWRGETRTVYTGQGWERGPDEPEKGFAAVKIESPLAPSNKFDLSKAKTKEITASVTMENEAAYPVLFGAVGLSALAAIDGQDNPVGKLGWSSGDGVLHFDGKSSYPTTYELRSQATVVDTEGLRTVPITAVNRDALYAYLELPEKIPQRVRVLAETITKDAVTPYDKVKTIERYLSESGIYKYTNTPSKGSNEDFVYQFLFETKEGYCDYFSTAMAVMTRAIGMPSRWVKGFSSGSSQLDEAIERGLNRGVLSQEELNGSDTYTVRNADAHSWVEVYFPGYGWIPFEPTSGFSLPTIYDGTAAALETSAVPTDLPDNIGTPAADESWRVWAFGAAIATATAAVIFILIRFVPWWRLQKWILKKRRASNYNQALLIDFHRWLRYAKRKGYIRLEHETMRETINRWSRDSRWMEGDLNRLLRLFERAKYSSVSLTEADWNDADATIRKIRIAMK